MPRRELVHTRVSHAVTPTSAFTALRKTWHLHFCSDRTCRLVYECYACDDVAKNGRCQACRGVRRPVYISARDPQPCCLGNCAQVTDQAEIVRYKLAGPGPWFQCKTCARCHGWPCHEERKP